MTTLTVLAISWGVMTPVFLALMIYRSHLTNLETDQLFLSDENGTAAVHQEQNLIVHRVEVLTPVLKIMGVAITLTTIAMITMYIVHVIIPNAHLD